MSDKFGCDDHCDAMPHSKHPDMGKNTHKAMLWSDESRGAGHPKHHTKGKMMSQLNPDHGPHHHKG
jgi:hypothetical protein